MAIYKKTRIVTETETARLMLLRFKPGETTWDWCAECGRQVAWLEIPAAIEFLGDYGPLERSAVHWKSNRLCLRSLIE